MYSTISDRIEKLTGLITICSIDGIGAGRFYKLIERFGSAENILCASISDLTNTPGIGRELASNIKNKQDRKTAEEWVEKRKK